MSYSRRHHQAKVMIVIVVKNVNENIARDLEERIVGGISLNQMNIKLDCHTFKLVLVILSYKLIPINLLDRHRVLPILTQT